MISFLSGPLVSTSMTFHLQFLTARSGLAQLVGPDQCPFASLLPTATCSFSVSSWNITGGDEPHGENL